MSIQSHELPAGRSNHPVTTELAFVVGAVAALWLWQWVARTFVVPALGFGPGGPGFDAVGGLLVGGLVTGAVLLVGMGAVVAVYVTARDVEVGLGIPAADRLPTLAVALLVPVALVGTTKVVGVLTGTTYGTLALTSYGSASVVQFATLAGLGLFVGVPTLLIVCQVVVQGSFRRGVGGHVAAALTTLVAGFLLVDASGGLDTIPDRGKLLGAALFVLAVAVALYGIENTARAWLGYLALLPVGLFVAATVVSGVAAVETAAAVVFVVSQLAVLGVAAAGYERTGSLLVPALTYASYLLCGQAVIFLFEAGVQHW